jgi:hypothetical protein
MIKMAAFTIALMPVDYSAVQGNVEIRGTVRSYSRAPIGDARVYAVSPSSIQETVSNSRGHFYFLSLLPGRYLLVAQKSGYVSACLCCPRAPIESPVELSAGLEYDATVWLTNVCY